MVVTECNAAWNDYEFHRITKVTQEFFWHEFCDYYLEYIKNRIYDATDENSKRAAQYTLYTIYSNVLLLLAPIIPHSSEEMWQIFNSPAHSTSSHPTASPHPPFDSIHLHSYPKPDAHFESSKFDAAGLLLAQVISTIRQDKAANKLPLNCPITEATLTLPADAAQHVSSIEEEIKAAGRVEKLIVKEGAAFALQYVWGEPPQRLVK
jgi:valyl-tRNA synthetase